MSMPAALPPFVRRPLRLWWGAALAGWCLAAQAAGLLTILDGDALLIQGTQAQAAAEGVLVSDLALLRTGANTKVLRLEWDDGSVIDLGPDTQVMISPTAFGLRNKRAPSIYLLKGWAKQSSASTATPAGGLVTPKLDVQPFQGVLVAFVGADESWAFVESGSAQVLERDGASQKLTLKNGEVYQRPASGKGSVSPRPTPAQTQRVPRGFRDTLPHRAAAFKDRKVEPKPLPGPSVADLRDWFNAEPPLRKEFPRRFAPRVQESSFRGELIRQFGDHPEWVPVLYPERLQKSSAASRPKAP